MNKLLGSINQLPIPRSLMPRPHHWFVMLIFAAVISLLLSGMKLLVSPGPEYPFLLIFSAVVVSALWGGFWIGMFATLFTALLVSMLFLPETAANIYVRAFSITVYICEGTAISWLVYRQRHAMQSAELQREWLEVSLRSIGDAVIMTDTRGNILFMNEVAQVLTGWSVADATGHPLAAVFRIANERTRKPAINPVQKVLKTGKIQSLANHTVLISADGRTIPIDDSAAPIRDSQGNLHGVVLIFRDISATKSSLQKIREGELRFREFADSMPDIISRFDLNYKRIFVNKAYLHLTGKRRSEVLNKPLSDTLTERNHPWINYFDEVVSTGEAKIVVTPIPTVSGERTFSVRLIPEFSARKKVVSILSIAQDITAAKEEEERKDQFISIASHELKTPITSLKAYAQLARKHLETHPDSKIKSLVQRMEVQVDNITSLVSDLLDVTKIEAGKLLLPKDTFDINQLVREIAHDMDQTHPSHRIDIKGALKKYVFADRFRIGQVLTNLLTNAIKYSPDADTVVITLREKNGEAVIAVKDNGIGISEIDQQHIFERFYQTKAARDHEGRLSSLGLGLYITAEIVKRHGGRIWVDSTVGKGSTFSFTVPLSKAA